MAIGYARSSGAITGANVVSAGANFSVLPAVDNHIITAVNCYHSAASTALVSSDNQAPNSYTTHVLQRNTNSTTVTAAAIASAKVATSSGTFTVTITPNTTSANYIWGIAMEFSGLDTSSWFDKTGANQSANGSPSANTATVTASLANAQNDSLVIALSGFSSSTSTDTNIAIGVPTPATYNERYVVQDAYNTMGTEAAHKIVSAGETSSASWNHHTVTGDGWITVLATFKAVGTPTLAQSHYRWRNDDGTLVDLLYG